MRDRSGFREIVRRAAAVLAVAALAQCLLPLPLLAGRGDKAGTASGSELLIPVGARCVALSGSSLSTVSGLEALYWNPAGLARMGGNLNVFVSHMSYLGDIGVDYAAFGFDLAGEGTIGFDVKSLGIGQINVTTEDQPDGTGETTSPTFLTLGASFARKVSDKISMGVTAHVIVEKMASVSATGVAFNGGVQYSGLGGIDGLSVGVAIKNIGPSLRFDGSGLLRSVQVSDVNQTNSTLKIQAAAGDLPSTIEIGLGYRMPVLEGDQLDFTTTFQNNNYSDDEYKLGVEYGYRGLLFLRAGYSFSSKDQGADYIYGPTAGAGVQSTVGSARISFNYGYRFVQYFGGNNLFDLAFEF